MMSKQFRVLLTMDCERVRDSQFYPAGPLSWGESGRNISAFAELAMEHGFRVTFFAVPEAVEEHANLFKELLGAGHEVGLHLHPNSFRYGVNEYLGNLPGELQLAIIRDARDAFEAALGFRPASFRAGHFSANADTFRVLSSLGFKRGSSVIPGRHLAGTGGDWSNWKRHCQYVGSFFEAPVTVHYVRGSVLRVHTARHVLTLARRGFVVDALRGAASMLRGTGRFGTMQGRALVDLRIEEGSYSLTREIIKAEVDRMKDQDQLAALTAVTHSYVNYSAEDYGSREHGMSRRMHVKRMLGDLARGREGVFESRTLSELHRDFDNLTSVDQRTRNDPSQLCQSSDARKV